MKHNRAPLSAATQAILKAIRSVPKGKVATYGQVAEIAGLPRQARQVAWALHSCERTVPWHRIVGAGGKILLPAEAGLEQRLRLKQEGVNFRGDRVALQDFQYRAAKL